MILVLFHAEDFREFIVGCVRATTRIRKSRASNHRNENERVFKSKESPLDNALNFFVLDGALKPVETGSTFTGVDHRPKLCRRLGVFSYTGRLAHDSNLRFPLLFSMR
jgi:hypothetical protein